MISAHKFVLSISSPVFEAKFYGKLAGTTGSVELSARLYVRQFIRVVSLHVHPGGGGGGGVSFTRPLFLFIACFS